MEGSGSSPEVQVERQNKVAILDAGAQYGMDIEQQLKRQGFFAERLPFETPLDQLRSYSAIILSGGPESVYRQGAPQCDPNLFKTDVDRPPVLGICYGAHLMNYMLGGHVGRLPEREDGFTDVIVAPDSDMFDGLVPEQIVLMSHGDSVLEVAPDFEITARSGDIIAAIANPKARLYGVQFHPEVSTVQGPAMLRNFVEKIAGLEADYTYTSDDFVEDAVAEVQEKVGDRQVLAFISGGVDSSALALLLECSLPSDQLFLFHIDNGLMREGESQTVAETLAEAGIHVTVVDATEKFLNGRTVVDGQETPPLSEVIDPEVKRKIVGDVFIKVQDDIAEELNLEDDFMLAMGTLHTDLIESGSEHASSKADIIKSHHNDTSAVRQLRAEGRVLEPWRYLQKDDVRQVGKLLGLPQAVYERQPFPGPGLAIRIICAQEPFTPEGFSETAGQLAEFSADNIKAALLAIHTVGVQGDHRTYGHLVALSGEMDWEELVRLARIIPRQVHGINRVIYTFGEPFEGIIDDVTPTRVNTDSLTQLRTADSIVNKKLAEHGLDLSISQVPVVSFPINFGEYGSRSIGIRTITTTNFKTGDIAVPGVNFPEGVLLEIVEELSRLPGIARVAYDLTSKPPATTEWE